MAQVINLRDTERHPERCRAVTSNGKRCRNHAVGDSGFCRIHLPAKPERIGPFDAGAIRDLLEFGRRRLTGEYDVDDFGFDAELVEKFWAPLVRPLGKYYWRIEWRGIENVPAEGAALLVSNHAGTLPLDALVMKFGVYEEHPAHRHVRLLAADLAFRMPFVGPMARKMGNTLATGEDAERLLRSGELIGVFPEGYKGVGKGFKERYRLQRFGRGGAIELALRARVPMIPVAIVGAEEIYPMIANARLIARLCEWTLQSGWPSFTPCQSLFASRRRWFRLTPWSCGSVNCSWRRVTAFARRLRVVRGTPPARSPSRTWSSISSSCSPCA